ncbi:MAG: hypothetical protein ACLFUJ_05815 [Phycisphaerae bacterium]
MTRAACVLLILLCLSALAGGEERDESKPADIPAVKNLGALRQLEPVGMYGNWQIRAGLAEAGEFAGPWKLLCVHLKYAGKPDGDRSLKIPERSLARDRIGPLTWRIKSVGVKIAEALIQEHLMDEQRKDEPVERLFVQPVPAWTKGRFDLELFNPKTKKLLAETRIEVPADRHDHWVLLAEPGEAGEGEISMRASLKRRLPQFSDPHQAAWTLQPGQKPDPRILGSMPGRLGPDTPWPAEAFGGKKPAGKGPHYPLELEAAEQGLKIRSLTHLRSDPDCYLVRWWVDGKAVVLPRKQVAVDELVQRTRLLAEQQNHLLILPWRLPDYLGDLKVGQKLTCQVIYSPHGTSELPKLSWAGGLDKLRAIPEVSGPDQLMLISRPESFEVTGRMLQGRGGRGGR